MSGARAFAGWLEVTALENGWLTDVREVGESFPTAFMVKGEDAIAVLVKPNGKPATPAQSKWLHALERAGVECHVWSGDDMRDAFERLVSA